MQGHILKCPYCEVGIVHTNASERDMHLGSSSTMVKTTLVGCPTCHKVLGVLPIGYDELIEQQKKQKK